MSDKEKRCSLPSFPPKGGDGKNASSGRFAYEGLERVFHEKARLGILTSLITHPDGLLFADVKELCSLTDGNLSRHLQILVEAGLVEIWKNSAGRRSQTLCRITPRGLSRFVEYLATLERVVNDAARAEKTLKGNLGAKGSLPHGWAPA